MKNHDLIKHIQSAIDRVTARACVKQRIYTPTRQLLPRTIITPCARAPKLQARFISCSEIENRNLAYEAQAAS